MEKIEKSKEKWREKTSIKGGEGRKWRLGKRAFSSCSGAHCYWNCVSSAPNKWQRRKHHVAGSCDAGDGWSFTKRSLSASRCLVAKSRPTPLWPDRLYLTRLPLPWDFPARTLEWVIVSFSRWSPQPRGQTHVSYMTCRFFTAEPPGKPVSMS